MDFDSSRVYEFELWSPNGVRIGDISSLITRKQVTLQRNEAGTLIFEMDLTAFEDWVTAMGERDGRVLLNPYQTDIRIKRDGSYWQGFNVVTVDIDVPQNTSIGGSTALAPQTITVGCKGYLSLFADRYVTASYTNVDAAIIAENLITDTQGQTYGDAGVTIAGGNYRTGKLRERNYERQNVKTGIQNLTKLIDGRFDFDFTAEKQFVIYSQQGSRRSDFSLVYGGSGSNIAGFKLSRNGLSLYNRIIALGSGFGDDQLVSTVNDTVSQQNNYLREDIKLYNSIINQTELDQNAAADLDQEKDLLEIPQIVITGQELTGVPFLSIGDRVPITINDHPMLHSIGGYYRIEKMVIDIDENDFEASILLYFDNYAVT